MMMYIKAEMKPKIHTLTLITRVTRLEREWRKEKGEETSLPCCRWAGDNALWVVMR
jgi:hypothetical protein